MSLLAGLIRDQCAKSKQQRPATEEMVQQVVYTCINIGGGGRGCDDGGWMPWNCEW